MLGLGFAFKNTTFLVLMQTVIASYIASIEGMSFNWSPLWPTI